MITKIQSKETLLAMLVDMSDIAEGTMPITDPTWSLQMLMMKRGKGHVVPKHMHKRILKTSEQPQEAIVVIKGELDVSIFDRKGSIISKHTVTAGQCLFIIDGGHEVTMTKDALVYEFKTGPYVDDKIKL